MSLEPGFPADFLWGAATSAYQIEGSPLADGAGQSNWHRFSHSPGRVAGGDTGDVACDHYRRFREDVALMAKIGLTAYRFSVSWSRILPEGRGRVNEKGLDFYRRLVDALRENGIRPFVTLHHWDLPSALDDRGGWLNPDLAGRFADYASLLFRTLGDRVDLWATLNEPWVIVDGGYLNGLLAPGHASPWEAPRAAHNLLRAHAAAVRAFRAAPRGAIGLVVNLEPKHAVSDREEDRAAAVRADAYFNRQFLDPVFFGRYPEELAGIWGEAWPDFPDGDVDALREAIDFVGVNYYSRSVVGFDPAAFPVRAARVPQRQSTETEMGWEVYPEGLLEILLWVHERYGALPLYVTENGAAFYDPPVPSGPVVEDPLREAYLRDHLRALERARDRGVDVRGYFVWSLLDNFEWNHGFGKRFGIVHVDYATQRRTPKRSALAYAELIRTSRRRTGVAE